ncbi:hypothetical protein ACFUKV_09315 [Streptomyces paradoxus]|uniref:hypothetical protein n=1 Tax=Streptomyces paradoxus TaxID=66375 RepID=UPI0036390C5B
MACRGPDATGVHAGEHAALGHRRRAVIGIEGGRQPMTAPLRPGLAGSAGPAEGSAAPGRRAQLQRRGLCLDRWMREYGIAPE